MINAAYILEDLGEDNGFCMTIAVTNYRAKHKTYMTFGVSYKHGKLPLLLQCPLGLCTLTLGGYVCPLPTGVLGENVQDDTYLYQLPDI